MALLSSAILSGAVIALVFRPLVLSNISYKGSERLLWAARTAAITSPADPAQWDFWVRALDERVTDAHVFMVRSHPGQPSFAEDCKHHGLTADQGLTAYAKGELVAFPKPGGTRQGDYMALIRLSGMKGQRALLGFRDETGGSTPRASSVWSLWILFLGMTFALAIAGGYLVGYLVLVRPLSKIAALADRGKDGPRPLESTNDLDALKARMEALVRDNHEATLKASRLSIELDRIRSDLKGAQATLLRAEKLASVGQLAAGIAHEIGNPVGIILGLSDLLKKDAGDEDEVRRFATEVNHAAERVDGIIRDLLAFARPARDEQASADVNEVVESTVNLLKPHQRFREVEVATEFDEGPLLVEIRASQLQQVLVNLLMNAADAMKGQGRIGIRVTPDERYIRMDVEDDGPGIPEKDKERIFDPFFTTKAPGEGTGLGLAICAQIVEVYGGRISVKKGKNGGAVFSVQLWRAEP
ncbi:MAG: hypothetical protein GXP54_08155 [Deltaproteobacteria bacterium]|nr:hypothetical protein [Deltaproteobacteria bacterium]